jgi:hypothetical protein
MDKIGKDTKAQIQMHLHSPRGGLLKIRSHVLSGRLKSRSVITHVGYDLEHTVVSLAQFDQSQRKLLH